MQTTKIDGTDDAGFFFPKWMKIALDYANELLCELPAYLLYVVFSFPRLVLLLRWAMNHTKQKLVKMWIRLQIYKWRYSGAFSRTVMLRQIYFSFIISRFATIQFWMESVLNFLFVVNQEIQMQPSHINTIYQIRLPWKLN